EDARAVLDSARRRNGAVRHLRDETRKIEPGDRGESSDQILAQGGAKSLDPGAERQDIFALAPAPHQKIGLPKIVVRRELSDEPALSDARFTKHECKLWLSMAGTLPKRREPLEVNATADERRCRLS